MALSLMITKGFSRRSVAQATTEQTVISPHHALAIVIAVMQPKRHDVSARPRRGAGDDNHGVPRSKGDGAELGRIDSDATR